MRFKAKDNIAKGKPRIYYTAHKSDHERCFGRVKADIFKHSDPVIFYDPDPDDPEDSGNFLSDIASMQLIVIPVTEKFLFDDCKARTVVFETAGKSGVPVLPLLFEHGIEADFNSICGDLQYLDPEADDPTAISYDEKLSRFLKSVLIGDELAEKIRAAFDAYIFLSYRKKDRLCAQSLMRLIHRNELCRDIAVWYDEFLVPGENFNDAIAKAMEKSAVFALAVTPNLINEENYVKNIEYPKALEIGKPVLAAQMEATDRRELEEKFPGIPEFTDPGDERQINALLLSAAVDLAKKEHGTDIRHGFFIGLAYLGGIDVEKDSDRALKLITGAAEKGLPEAMEKLASMYLSGTGVKKDLKMAEKWQERYIDKLRGEYERNREESGFYILAGAMSELGAVYDEDKRTEKALECYIFIQSTAESIEKPADPVKLREILSEVHLKAGMACEKLGRLDDASLHYNKGLNAAREYKTLAHGDIRSQCACISFLNCLGSIGEKKGDISGSVSCCESALEAAEGLWEKFGGEEVRRVLSASYKRLGSLYNRLDDYTKALGQYRKALKLTEKAARELGDVWLMSEEARLCTDIGEVYDRAKQFGEAERHYKRAIEIYRQIDSREGIGSATRGIYRVNNLLGKVYERQGLNDEAEACYTADSDDRGLRFDARSVEARRINSLSLINLGRLELKLGDTQKALRCCSTALKMRESLAAQTQTVETLLELSAAYVRIADIYDDMDRKDEAKENYFAALAIDKKIAARTDTVKAKRDLSDDYMRIGRFFLTLNLNAPASDYFGRALEIRSDLAAKTGTVLSYTDLSETCSGLGDLETAEGRLSSAKKYYIKAIEAAEKAEAEASPESRRSEVCCLTSLARIYEETRETQKALEYYRVCLEKDSALFAQTGMTASLRDMSFDNRRIGDVLTALGDNVQAKEHYLSASQLGERAAEMLMTPVPLKELGRSYRKYAEFLLKSGDTEGAEEYSGKARKAFDEAEKAQARDENTELIEHGADCFNCGSLLIKKGDLEGAVRQLRECEHTRSLIFGKYPSPHRKAELIKTRLVLAEAYERLGDPAPAAAFRKLCEEMRE